MKKREQCSQCKLLKNISKAWLKKAYDILFTCDETGVYYFELKQKCSSRILRILKTRDARRLIIAKQTRTVRKILYTIFLDKKRQGPEVIKLFFMLNSTEHENFPAHKS